MGKSLHPQLQAEAKGIGAGRSLTFYSDMESLLSELEAEMPAIPDNAIFEFVYNAISETIQELHRTADANRRRPTR